MSALTIDLIYQAFYCLVTNYHKLSDFHNTHLLSYNSFGLGVQPQVFWVLCSRYHQPEIKMTRDLIPT